MKKIDPYKSAERLESWKKSNIKTISKTNLKLLKDYIGDMELGMNVSGNVKGRRSPIKLLSLASRLKRIMEFYEKSFKKKDISKATEREMHRLFLDMSSGKLTKDNGDLYRDVGDYIKRFKSFWHWNMKREKKAGNIVLDITEDLSVSHKVKPPFVYFEKEDLEKMCEIADYDTKVIMMFMYDTGIRSPTELQNVRFCDFENNFRTLNIREETTKNKYGRKIKLMLCSEAVKKFIQDNNFSGEDLVFQFNPATMNKRLKKLGAAVIGQGITKGRKKGSELTMYDFRHSSGCYWLLRYKSEMSLMYRFAWKNREMVDYYTELLGMRDIITEEDMEVGLDKSNMQKEIDELRQRVTELGDLWLFSASKGLIKTPSKKMLKEAIERGFFTEEEAENFATINERVV